uniref:DUF222 domain-containing protein n=1 Tax=Sphaerisporangium perillae TaxID=2935860 RepID=UPI00200DAEF7
MKADAADLSMRGRSRPPARDVLGPDWWAAVVARSSGYSSDGSAARDIDPLDYAHACDPHDPDPHDPDPRDAQPHVRDPHMWDPRGSAGAEDSSAPCDGIAPGDDATSETGSSGPGPGVGGRASWVLVGRVREAAGELAVAGVPESAAICMAEVEDLVWARDRLSSAIAARVGRVHATGEVKSGGHASTKTWLRSACGMSMAGAGRLVGMAVELARLPVVRGRFASGALAEGMVSAICAATAPLTDRQTELAEPILVALADEATVAEVTRAGRYLREVLCPGGLAGEADADYAGRFLIVRESCSGGVEGEFRLPREAAGRLRALLDAYAKPRAEGDDRPLRVRNADALIGFLEKEISTELLVLVNAGSLPDDIPGPTCPTPLQGAGPAAACAAGVGRPGQPAQHAKIAEPTEALEPSGGRVESPGGRVESPGGRVVLPEGRTKAHEGRAEAHEGRGEPFGGRVEGNEPVGAPAGAAEPAEAYEGRAEAPEGRAEPFGGRVEGNEPVGAPAGAAEPAEAAREVDDGCGRCGHRADRWFPGLLAATGQLLPVGDVHRLARTSTLVRIVMDAEGQV